MVFEALVDAGREFASVEIPMGCKSVPVAATIQLSSSGEYLGLVAKEPKSSDWGPYINCTTSGKPGLGIHKLEHLTGIRTLPTGGAIIPDDDRVNYKQRQTAAFLLECAQRSNIHQIEILSSFARCLTDNQGLRAKLSDQIRALRLNSALNVSIQIDGESWYKSSSVCEFWHRTGFDLSDEWPITFRNSHTQGQRGQRRIKARSRYAQESIGRCLSCGSIGHLIRIMDLSLDGFGTKPKLVSAARSAYQSRGVSQTFNSPLCKNCGELAPKGWNSLRERATHRLDVGEHRYVFWGDEPSYAPWKYYRERDFTGIRTRITNSPGRASESAKPFRMLGLGAHNSTAYVVVYIDLLSSSFGPPLKRWMDYQAGLVSLLGRSITLFDLCFGLRRRGISGHTAVPGSDMSKQEAWLFSQLLGLSFGIASCPPELLRQTILLLSSEWEAFPIDRLVLLNIGLGVTSPDDLEAAAVAGEPALNAFNLGDLCSLLDYARTQIPTQAQTLVQRACMLQQAASAPAERISCMVNRFERSDGKKLLYAEPPLGNYVRWRVREILLKIRLPETHSIREQAWFWKGYYSERLRQANQIKSQGGNLT